MQMQNLLGQRHGQLKQLAKYFDGVKFGANTEIEKKIASRLFAWGYLKIVNGYYSTNVGEVGTGA